MADISKIKLPSGTEYNLKDAKAREDIAAIQSSIASGVHFIGTTTTELTDGDTTNPITINGANVTAVAGDLVTYGDSEFLFNGTAWLFFGDFGSLGDLAFKDSASGSFTPSGSVSLTNTNQTATVSKASSGTATYTPEGTVTAPTISLKTAGSTTTVQNPSPVTVAKTITTAAPGTTAPLNAITYYSVASETLSLYQIGYTTGDSITTSNVTVKTGDAAYESSAPIFSGTGARLVTGNISVPSSASFSGTEGTVTVS